MAFVAAYIVPHTKRIISEQALPNEREVLQGTYRALDQIRDDIQRIKPKNIFIISPHHVSQADRFSILAKSVIKGDAFDHVVEMNTNATIAEKIQSQAIRGNVPVTLNENEDLDNGMAIPLHRLIVDEVRKDAKLIPLTTSYLDPHQHREFGEIIGKIINEESEPSIFIVSANLSHRLSDDSKQGFNVLGQKYDAAIKDLLTANKITDIDQISYEVVSNAGECSHNPLLVLVGIIDGKQIETTVHTYEALEGIGYLTASIAIKA
jgi:AmmeMemoRadiSam system protein B